LLVTLSVDREPTIPAVYCVPTELIECQQAEVEIGGKKAGRAGQKANLQQQLTHALYEWRSDHYIIPSMARCQVFHRLQRVHQGRHNLVHELGHEQRSMSPSRI